MNIASGYSVAGNYGGYNTQKTQTSSKAFTLPKNEAPMIGALTFQPSDIKYDPFKDIAENGKVSFPKGMQTKTTPTRSDEEILKDLEELAKQQAKRGEQLQSGDRFAELIDEYVSSVSPDRASILEKAVTEIHERLQPDEDYTMNAIYQQVNSQITQEEEEKDEKELIDYLLEALKNKGKGKGDKGGTITGITDDGTHRTVNIDHGGGKTTTLNYVNGEFTSMQIAGNNYDVGNIDNSTGAVKNAQFFDDNGNRIMDYGLDSVGLCQNYTNEEGERLQEIIGVYNAAYDFTIGRNNGGIGSNTAKNAYSSTYNRLMNEAVA